MSGLPGRPQVLSRREMLQLLAGVGISAVLPARVGLGGAARRPNVLFIAVDDLNTRIGCFGFPEVKTPHLDRLAARGVRFERAYCQVPLCNPCRSSVLTGRRPATTRVLDNSARFREVLPEVVTLPQHFQNQGYWTARVGKIYHGGLAEQAGWDVVRRAPVPAELRRQVQVVAEGGNLEAPRARQRGGAQPGGKPRRRGSPLAWRVIDGPDEALPDGQITRRALELLRERPADRPFFLAVGYHKPHLPWVAPRKYFDLYSLDAIQLPRVPLRYREWTEANRPRRRWNEGMSEEEVPRLILAYQACTSFLDAQVEGLLDALDEAGVADDTVVILWGDHGFLLGEHGLWRKVHLYEPSARGPIICAAPGRRARGAPCRRLVEFVDIYPTLADLCRLPAPEGVEGTSFAPLMDDPHRAWKEAAFTENSRQQSVRTERRRYIQGRDGSQAELYDHQSDPGEYVNLADSPDHWPVVAEMKALLEAGWQAAAP